MTDKRFYFDENGINDREYEFSVLGEDELVEIINELNDENKELKEKNKFILGQIKAFRDDCDIYLDFDGVSTLNRLLDILGEEK